MDSSAYMFAANSTVILLMLFIFRTVERNNKRVEKKVDEAIALLDLVLRDEFRKVDTLSRQGEKDDAIWLYKEIAGGTFANAKKAVERRAAASIPDRE